MKKGVVSVILVVTLFFGGFYVAQAALTLPQVEAILGLLQAFGVDYNTINNVRNILISTVEPSSLPRGIEQATNKIISEEGTLLPSVKLEARVSRWVRRLRTNFEDTWQNENKEIFVGVTNGRPDELGILINVGNPDKTYKPNWTCEKLGNWSGTTKPYDHWEENVENPVPGEYRVKCGESEDYVIVKQGKIAQ